MQAAIAEADAAHLSVVTLRLLCICMLSRNHFPLVGLFNDEIGRRGTFLALALPRCWNGRKSRQGVLYTGS